MRADPALLATPTVVPPVAVPAPGTADGEPHAVDASVAPAAVISAPGTRGGWTLDAPLPTRREGPAPRWRCPEHQADYDEARAAEARAREAARHTTRVCAARVADLYYPSGKHWRTIYQVVEYRTDDVPHTIALARDGDEVLLTGALDRGSARALWAQITDRAAEHLEAYRMRSGAMVDSPMTWARGSVAQDLVRAVRASDTRVPLAATHPQRYYYSPAQRRWFTPPDLREITWDRSPDTVGTPHPAWAARRAEWEARRRMRAPASGAGPVPAPGSRPAFSALARPTAPPPPLLEPVLADATATEALPGPVAAGDFGQQRMLRSVRITLGTQWDGVVLVELHDTVDGTTRAVIGLPRDGAAPADVRAADRALAHAQVRRLWVSRASEWTRALVDVPWLPAVAVTTSPSTFVAPLAALLVPLPIVALWLCSGVAELDAHRVRATGHAGHLLH